ncbi:MAG: hypothetical protein WC959_05465 [Kiritimatiellales bacterium]
MKKIIIVLALITTGAKCAEIVSEIVAQRGPRLTHRVIIRNANGSVTPHDRTYNMVLSTVNALEFEATKTQFRNELLNMSATNDVAAAP